VWHGDLRFRTIWISDVHLGASACRANHLLDFLRLTQSDQLYLVGNIVDGPQLRRRWHWPREHNDVVQKILRKARKGTKVVFIPGRHDEFGHKFERFSFGGIEVCSEVVHVTADGRRLLVVGGDRYDHAAQHTRIRALMEGRLNRLARRVRRWLDALSDIAASPRTYGERHRELAAQRTASRIAEFERGVTAEARRRGVDGVVCGHSQNAAIRDIDGVLYCNDGDWVESLTALVEDRSGRLRILRWREVMARSAEFIPWTPIMEREVAIANSDRK
jgi:UDP-2,3-diacylglucosamine pyrophosphatase LpxH